MFGFGKSNAAIDRFAAELVGEFRGRFPIEKEKELGTNKLKPARSLGKAAGELVDRKVAAFAAENKLGVYGKARLLNRVKWEMAELGYSKEFVDVTLSELTLSMARKARPAPVK